MRNTNKIYADQDPNWEGYGKWWVKLMFPRWWNPLFWLLIVLCMMAGAIDGVYTVIETVYDFIRKYKI